MTHVALSLDMYIYIRHPIHSSLRNGPHHVSNCSLKPLQRAYVLLEAGLKKEVIVGELVLFFLGGVGFACFPGEGEKAMIFLMGSKTSILDSMTRFRGNPSFSVVDSKYLSPSEILES
jgi:hypothetical protein